MKKIKSYLFDMLDCLALAAIIAFLLFNFVFIIAQVDGSSMYPNLVDGDRGLSFVITKNLGIDRFDICVIDTDKSEDLLVKRVIGLPNETVEYKDNVLYIDGVAYKENFLGDVTTEDFIIQLGEDEYFCMGDNRNASRDSRYYGPFKSSEIKSTHFFIFSPFERFGIK